MICTEKYSSLEKKIYNSYKVKYNHWCTNYYSGHWSEMVINQDFQIRYYGRN